MAAERAELGRRDGAWPFLLLIALAAASVLVPLFWQKLRAEAMVRNEDHAARMVRRVREAQVRFFETEGRYGWVEDLDRAGLLEGFDVRREGDRFYVALGGYRIDVLLPGGRIGGDKVDLVAQGGDRPFDFDLAQRHFAVVARPLEPMVSGWRSYYVDEDDVLYTNEGVTDLDGAKQNALPRIQVKKSVQLHESRPMLWQSPDDLRVAD